MIRVSLTFSLLLLGSTAFGQGNQYPYGPAPYPGNFLPNYYNRQTQPLSPYLNLLRGGNPGVNYFYGVRPGLPTGGMVPGQYSGYPVMPGGGLQSRMGYLPAGANPTQDPLQLPAVGEPIESLPSSGRPVMFVGATAFSRPFPNMPNSAAARPGVLGNAAPKPYQPSRGRTRP